MPLFRSKKSIPHFLVILLLLSFAGSTHGFVLCCGPDDHMHIETTFNGVDCGHFPPSPLQPRDSHYLTADSPLASTPCYACTDIPLASPQYLLQEKYGTPSAHNRKIVSAAADLASSFASRTTHTTSSAQVAHQPAQSHCTFNQLLSSVLRI